MICRDKLMQKLNLLINVSMHKRVHHKTQPIEACDISYIFQDKFFQYNQLIYSCKVRCILVMIKKSVNKIHHKMLKIMLEHIALRSCCIACDICMYINIFVKLKILWAVDRELFVSFLEVYGRIFVIRRCTTFYLYF